MEKLNGLMMRAHGLLEDPILCRKITTATAWCAVGAMALMPDTNGG
jgi:hypothetical protein